ncbi:sugar ABC transporter [Enterobacter sp. 10-1]|uniref:sugar ABC transporter n=1 Tax=Raoultella sp. 10-1 TaxID=2683201 RepID=UPI000BA2D667|nr:MULTISPECIES: sugar ABC transporter [Enterobacteriaceae]MVT02599.1 sugar ABC transporter [Raoultella sp. 10-1]PAC15083.1 sugar ABC transporter [Enterobacter sp. 10-1]
MLYIVECTYTDPQSEAGWNDFYNREKLPALLSVDGFSTSQRFRATTPGCPAWLAIHTVRDAAVLTSAEYRQKGGGSFARWQANISDWRRSLYQCTDPAPAVSADQILLLAAQPVDFIANELGYRPWQLRAAGLDSFPEGRLAYVIPADNAALLSTMADIRLYQPLTGQLRPQKGGDRAHR